MPAAFSRKSYLGEADVGQAATFFDIDRTLVVATSLETCFLRQGRLRGIIDPLALLRNIPAGLRALKLLPPGRQGRFDIPPNLSLKTHLRYAFLSGNKAYLKGLTAATSRALAEVTFQEEVLPRLSRRGQEQISWHRSQDRLIVLLTGTLDFLGEPLRAHLAADYLLAAQPEIEAGKLTGRLVGLHPYGNRKQTLLLAFARDKDIDLGGSYAYADHHTDIPFLEAVGHPVAVNPDPKLADIARRRGWKIEVF
jgi:HAD superfamily hydrolase (TIGR01490 family)